MRLEAKLRKSLAIASYGDATFCDGNGKGEKSVEIERDTAGDAILAAGTQGKCARGAAHGQNPRWSVPLTSSCDAAGRQEQFPKVAGSARRHYSALGKRRSL